MQEIRLSKLIPDMEELRSRSNFDILPKDLPKFVEFTRQLYYLWLATSKELNRPPPTYNRLTSDVRKQLKFQAKKTQLRSVYTQHYNEIHPEIPCNLEFVEFLLCKPKRGESGVETVTILTSPYPVYTKWDTKTKSYRRVEQTFSCGHDCHYCPKETKLVEDPQTGKSTRIDVMPRSYLTDEPACRRGAAHSFDCVEQIYARLESLQVCGHPTDKLELIWIGGTLTEYPPEYITEFARDMYYACNTFPACHNRPRQNLEEELQININGKCRIIGLTIETRPDAFSSAAKGDGGEMAMFLRRLGVTRVQMGVQHTDDAILKKVNRGCYLKDSQEALRLLKNLGIKTIIHLMPDLPGSSPEIDKRMLERAVTDPTLDSDEIKIYPTATTQHTRILKWFMEGKYMPYAEKNIETLIEVLLDFKLRVPRWVRLPRVVRDIPDGYIEAGIKCGNLRQVLASRLEAKGQVCECIRCREVGNAEVKTSCWDIHKHYAQGAWEYFISKTSNDTKKSKLLGFTRLRLSREAGRGLRGEVLVPELVGSALLRELHVYGRTQSKRRTVGLSSGVSHVQHKGLGMELVAKAKQIAWAHGYAKIAVTSGVGVRGYYTDKCGFVMEPDGLYPTQPLGVSFRGLCERLWLLWASDNLDSHHYLIMISVVCWSLMIAYMLLQKVY
jgi:ELP3 family radical SAM enzyme/protein acetyltransferase